jgi:hypothetical protein
MRIFEIWNQTAQDAVKKKIKNKKIGGSPYGSYPERAQINIRRKNGLDRF